MTDMRVLKAKLVQGEELPYDNPEELGVPPSQPTESTLRLQVELKKLELLHVREQKELRKLSIDTGHFINL